MLCVTNDRLEEFCPVETLACRNTAACNTLIDPSHSRCMFTQDIIDGPDLCWIERGGNSGQSPAWEVFNDLVSCVQNVDCDQEDVIQNRTEDDKQMQNHHVKCNTTNRKQKDIFFSLGERRNSKPTNLRIGQFLLLDSGC